MVRETEAKIQLQAGEIDTLRAKLVALGGRPGPIDDELNVVFGLKGAGLRSGWRTLRLRMYDGRPDALLTCKGPAAKDSEYKSREEVEVRVSDAISARELLEQLGFRTKARYDKRREHWYLNGTIVALDRLAFGEFLEVEGEAPAIAAVLSHLGMAGRPHICTGYARLSRQSAKLPA